MMVQALISFTTVALLAARAVNIFVVLSAQCSVLSAQCSVLSAQCSVSSGVPVLVGGFGGAKDFLG